MEDFFKVGASGYLKWVVSLFTKCKLYHYEKEQCTESGAWLKVVQAPEPADIVW